jgi:hypothetical protein
MTNKAGTKDRKSVEANLDASLARLQTANAKHAADVRRRLVEALEKLPTDYIVPDNIIPYRCTIPGIARNLQIMTQVDRHAPSPAAVNGEFDRVISALHKLEAVAGLFDEDALIDAAARPELDKPLPKRRGQRCLSVALSLRLIILAGQASELARDIDAVRPDAAIKAKQGRKQKTAAAAIAAFLYQEFERITGGQPGRSVCSDKDNQKAREAGKFVQLVREVFGILGVRDAPAEAARQAIRDAKPMGSNQDLD